MTTLTDKKYALLKELNVHVWWRFDAKLTYWLRDNGNFSDEDKLLALEYGGVDNWNGYSHAQEMAEDDGLSWGELGAEDKLGYLESAGVDNWGYYSESINNYLKDYSGVQPTPQEYVDIFESIPNPEGWGNYDSYKSQVAKFEKELS